MRASLMRASAGVVGRVGEMGVTRRARQSCAGERLRPPPTRTDRDEATRRRILVAEPPMLGLLRHLPPRRRATLTPALTLRTEFVGDGVRSFSAGGFRAVLLLRPLHPCVPGRSRAVCARPRHADRSPPRSARAP